MLLTGTGIITFYSPLFALRLSFLLSPVIIRSSRSAPLVLTRWNATVFSRSARGRQDTSGLLRRMRQIVLCCKMPAEAPCARARKAPLQISTLRIGLAPFCYALSASLSSFAPTAHRTFFQLFKSPQNDGENRQRQIRPRRTRRQLLGHLLNR